MRFHRGGYEASAPGGKPVRRFKEKKAALDWLAHYRLTGQDSEAGRDLNVGKMIEEFLTARSVFWRPATLAHHRAMLTGKHMWGKVHEKVPVRAVTRHLLQRWIGEKIQKAAVRTVLQEVRIWRELWVWAMRQGYVATDPSSDLEKPRLPRRIARKVLEAHELLALIDSAPPPFRLAWMLGGIQGLRRAEILRATWEWVDLKGRRLLVLDGKTGQDVLPLAEWVAEELAAAGKREGPLVPVTLGKLRRQFMAQLKQLDIKGAVTIHTLRRTSATLLDFTGCPYGLVKFLLRHLGESDVTGRYVIADVESSRAHLETMAKAVRTSKVRSLASRG